MPGAVGVAGIEPVEAFAARDVPLQIGPVVDRGPALGRVRMLEAVAPVGDPRFIDRLKTIMERRRVPKDIIESLFATGGAAPEQPDLLEDK